MSTQALCKTFVKAIVILALPGIAFADLAQTSTLMVNQTLDLGSGAVASSGGDLLWTGSAIALQGSDTAFNFGGVGSAAYAAYTQTFILNNILNGGSATPIPNSRLPVGDVFAVGTAKYSAKVLVTANSGGSITLQFTTYGAPAPTGAPSITSAVLNNSSFIPLGFPNYGIAPSSLFVIIGRALADQGDNTLHASDGAGLQTTLNGTTITVIIGSTVVHPAMYYATPTQLTAVLPAATPLGTGTVFVTHNGLISTSATMKVVGSALGIDTYNGSGLATDSVSGALLTYTNSGKPGETIVLWATGLGPDPLDSDAVYTTTPHAVNMTMQAYLGGTPVPIIYKGSSGYPGVNVIIFTIPEGVATGCYVPFGSTTSSGPAVASNLVTLPIMTSGGICSDPFYGISGDQISTFSGQPKVKSGVVSVYQWTYPGATAGSPAAVTSWAEADFQSIAGGSYAGNGTVSLGGCTLQIAPVSSPAGAPAALDAGTIMATPPSGVPVTLGAVPGAYSFTLPTGAIPTAGGTFAFSGSGGKDVAAFNTTLNFPAPFLTWTNQSASATVARAGSQLVTWTGGAVGSYVIISGSSSISFAGTATYTCIAPQAAGQFTVPSYILLGLPAGSGSTFVQNTTALTPFSAGGLDFGSAFGAVRISVKTIFN